MSNKEENIIESSPLTTSSLHEHDFHLDLDGQVTCNICKSKDDSGKSSIFEAQIDFE